MDKLVYLLLVQMISHNYHIPKRMVSRKASIEFPYNIEVIGENLYVPWPLDISDDKLYFTERSGAVRVIENGIINPDPPLIHTGNTTWAPSGIVFIN